MANGTVSSAVARPVRTAVQAAPAWVVTEFVDSFFVDLTEKQYGALVAALMLLFSWLQVLGENVLGKAFMRRLSAPAVPVVDKGDGSEVDQEVLDVERVEPTPNPYNDPDFDGVQDDGLGEGR